MQETLDIYVQTEDLGNDKTYFITTIPTGHHIDINLHLDFASDHYIESVKTPFLLSIPKQLPK